MSGRGIYEQGLLGYYHRAWRDYGHGAIGDLQTASQPTRRGEERTIAGLAVDTRESMASDLSTI